jgi:hypothetical protein
MSTRIKLSITDRSGREVSAGGHLLDDAAPDTAARFKAALPIKETLRHVRWSGEAGYVLVDGLRDPGLELENRMSFFCRGTIGFRPEHGEVAIAYGSAQARDWWGIGWAARVAELDGDDSPFLDAVKRTQVEGAMQLVISAEEG